MGCRRLHSAATLRAISAAIGRTRTRSVAVIFPPAPAPELAKQEALPALRAYADRLGKQVVVVGGDETLRARAVAAGFPVATSLEEWQADEPEAALMGWPPAGRAGAEHAPESVFVLPEPAAGGDGDVPREEMPEYVRRIRDLGGHYTGPLEAEPARTGQTRRLPRITMPLPAVELDPDGDTADAVRLAQERREERITSAIRRTGGPLLGLDEPWAVGEMPPDAGDGEAPESESL